MVAWACCWGPSRSGEECYVSALSALWKTHFSERMTENNQHLLSICASSLASPGFCHVLGSLLGFPFLSNIKCQKTLRQQSSKESCLNKSPPSCTYSCNKYLMSPIVPQALPQFLEIQPWMQQRVLSLTELTGLRRHAVTNRRLYVNARVIETHALVRTRLRSPNP